MKQQNLSSPTPLEVGLITLMALTLISACGSDQSKKAKRANENKSTTQSPLAHKKTSKKSSNEEECKKGEVYFDLTSLLPERSPESKSEGDAKKENQVSKENNKKVVQFQLTDLAFLEAGTRPSSGGTTGSPVVRLDMDGSAIEYFFKQKNSKIHSEVSTKSRLFEKIELLQLDQQKGCKSLVFLENGKLREFKVLTYGSRRLELEAVEGNEFRVYTLGSQNLVLEINQFILEPKLEVCDDEAPESVWTKYSYTYQAYLAGQESWSSISKELATLFKKSGEDNEILEQALKSPGAQNGNLKKDKLRRLTSQNIQIPLEIHKMMVDRIKTQANDPESEFSKSKFCGL